MLRFYFFFQKNGNSLLNLLSPLFGEYVFYFFCRHFKDIQDWFHYFCSLFQSAFPFEFGAVSPEQNDQIPLQVVLREEKKTDEICGRCDGGMTGNAVWRSMDQRQGMTTRWAPASYQWRDMGSH